jgi:hypothetical protein
MNTPPNPTDPREVKVRRRWRATFLAMASIVAFAISRQQVPASTAAAAEPPTLTQPAPGQSAGCDSAQGARPSRAAPGASAPAPTKLSDADRLKALSSISRVDRPLRDYLRRYGQFPVGTNAEITKALTGANPEKVVFVVHQESPMNDAGELVDAWGTPFFFHQISGKQMEIRSAGPDRQMWDADDVKAPCN